MLLRLPSRRSRADGHSSSSRSELVVPHLLRRHGPVLVVMVAVLALAASPALGASITLLDPSPANGARIQTTDKGADVTISWAADTTGCTNTSFSARAVFAGPRPFTGNSVFGANPSGTQTINFRTAVVDDTFSWYVVMSCTGVGEIRSETRSFTLVPPDPNPRLEGRYLANATGSSSAYWTLRSLCPLSACDATVKMVGVPKFTLKYNAAKRSFTGFTAKAVGSCRKSYFRTYKNAYKVRLHVQVSAKTTTVVGAQSFAQTLQGRLTSTFTPTARGRELGCKATTRKQPLRMSLT